MKIALYHNLTSGGSKREVYAFTKKFIESGHTVHLYIPETADEGFLPLIHIVHKHSSFPLRILPPVRQRMPGVREYANLVILSINFHRINSLAGRVAQEIDNSDYDFVFLHHDRIVQSPFLLRHLQTPSVYFCAEPMRLYYEPSVDRPYTQSISLLSRLQNNWYFLPKAFARFLVKNIDSKNIKHASLLLTNSFFSAEAIYRAYCMRARVIYLGVDIDKFRPIKIPKGNFVLSVGYIGALKGQDFLIKAIGKIPESRRPELLLVGNTISQQEKIYLEFLAQQYNVRLRYEINVSEDRLVEAYNQALVFVYSPIMEPFGLAPLESMACGTPVVAVKEGGVRESVVEGLTGFLVERVPDLFADKLSNLLDNQNLRQNLGKQARKYISEFWTWDHAYCRFMQVLNQHSLVAE